jgi:hypothetical protein
MKANKNVLKVLIQNAKKESIYALVESMVSYFESFDYDNRRINAIYNILAGEPIKTIDDVNMTEVIAKSDWIFNNNNNWHVIKDSLKPINVDNINSEVTIRYEYTIDSDNIVRNSTYSLSFIDYPNILK